MSSIVTEMNGTHTLRLPVRTYGMADPVRSLSNTSNLARIGTGGRREIMKPSKDLDEQIDEILHKYGAEEGEFTYSLRQEILDIIEQREREARIDELENFIATMVVIHGNEPARSVSTAKIMERIESLKAIKQR